MRECERGDHRPSDKDGHVSSTNREKERGGWRTSASKIKREKEDERQKRTMVNECERRSVEREGVKERPRGRRTGKAQGERDGQRARARSPT